jgi:hypothetical protein
MIENFVEYDFHEEKSGAVLVIVNQFFERLLFLLNILKIIKLLISNLK